MHQPSGQHHRSYYPPGRRAGPLFHQHLPWHRRASLSKSLRSSETTVLFDSETLVSTTHRLFLLSYTYGFTECLHVPESRVLAHYRWFGSSSHRAQCCRHYMSTLGRERLPTLVGQRSRLSDTSCPHSTHRHSQQRFIGPRRFARRLGNRWDGDGGPPLTLGTSHDSAIHVVPCSVQKKCSISIRMKLRICQFLAEEHVWETNGKGEKEHIQHEPARLTVAGDLQESSICRLGHPARIRTSDSCGFKPKN